MFPIVMRASRPPDHSLTWCWVLLSIWPSLTFILSCTVPNSAFISSTVASSWFSSLFIRGSQRHPFIGAWKEEYIYWLRPAVLLAHLEHYHSLLRQFWALLTPLITSYCSSANRPLVGKAQNRRGLIWSIWAHPNTRQCWFHQGYKQQQAQILYAVALCTVMRS